MLRIKGHELVARKEAGIRNQRGETNVAGGIPNEQDAVVSEGVHLMR